MSLVAIRTGSSEALRRELEAQVEGEVRFDDISRALYSTDASVYQIQPAGVVIPKHRQDILRTLEICRRHRVPITMRGGGTSQAGQAIGEGLQIDVSKYYNHLLEVNAAQLWVRVEPGIVLDELNAQLAPLGLRFAPDLTTASRATLGGMMANNSSGARSVLYGKTIDHVLEQTVLLSDGSVVHFRDVPRDEVPSGDTLEAACYRTVLGLARQHAAEIDRAYPKILRRVAGYNLDEFTCATRPVNLSKIMVGSEGTLGIILEAKLRLVPLPKAKAVMVIAFSDLLESLAATPVILLHGPSAVEVMDKSILDYTRQNAALDRIRNAFIDGDPAATLCVEFYADRKEDLPPRLQALEQDLRSRNLGYSYRSETDPASQAKIWSLREASLGLSMAMKSDAKSISFVEDTAVAPEKLRDYIERFLALLHRYGTTAGIYAHASVGLLHVRPVINMKTEEGVRKFAAIAQEVADLALEFGGTISGEHGDGLVRSPFLKQMFGSELYEAFRQMKRAFDPLGLFNPGKIVDPPPITSNLRFGAGYRTPNPKTWFDYDAYGGMGGAVEMCSGVGACRKKLTGAMCPSYMATREEAHSTRGRANVLRLAGLGDEGAYRVLDLCLECRACKSECPVGVDMARFKSEFLADYWSRHGTPLRARALGRIDRISVWGSRFAPLANWLNDTTLVRWLNEQILDIDRRRSLPAYQRETFEHWLADRSWGSLNARRRPGRLGGMSWGSQSWLQPAFSRLFRDVNARRRPGWLGDKSGGAGGFACPPVTLFNDTFTNHYDPQIGIAALEILEHAGRAVNVVRPGCCGRPLISQGLLKQAREYALKVVQGLFPIAGRGEKILFCEPSCLSAVKEDAPSLLRGDDRRKAEIVASACVLFDEYAATLDLPLQARPGRILLHGHCHQKSMGMLPATVALLARIPSATVVDLDAGCCGMAGSFGYDKHHYDVSLAIANHRLLPAVKSMAQDDVLVAPGTSCRRQIADFGGKTAVHPAVLIRSLLRPDKLSGVPLS